MIDRLAPLIRDRIGSAAYECRWVEPRSLLSPTRMDVLAPFIYAKHRRLGVDSLYARHLYAAHILAFNGAREPGSDKQGVDEFLCCFDALLDDVAEHGYRDELGPVPVGRGGILMDGAHRLAACLAYERPVWALFCDVPTWGYTADWLRLNDHHGARLPDAYLNAMVTEYVELVPDTHVVMLFPQFKLRGDPFAGARVWTGGFVELTERGTRNLMTITYPGVIWTEQKARLCFPEGGGNLCYGVLQGSPAQMAGIKAQIREWSGVGNHSCHITDTHGEAIRLAHALLNDNSIDWLNRGVMLGVPGRYESWCLDGSSVLEAYGLRTARDRDWLSWPDAPGSHNEEARHHAWPVSEIAYSPARHFYVGDVKCATPEVIRHMKEKRGEAKDLTDLQLLGQRPDKPVLLNCVYAHLQRPFAEHRGNATVVWTSEPVESADVYAYMDAFSYRGTTGSLDVLLMLEPHTVLPGQYDENVYARFDKVYSFVPSVYERSGKYEHLYLMAYGQPDATGKLREVPLGYFDRGERKRAIVMIHGDKHSDQPGEQYTARRQFAEWFAAHGKTPMDVYGRPPFVGLANYRGEAADKHETLSRYTFALALDNTYHPDWSSGYYTREVLDALYCGCIPIVKGCYDVEQYLPADCFIDLRQFGNLGALDEFLQDPYKCDVENYRAAIRRYLDSPEVQRYHAHSTYMRLFALAGAEPTGDWAPGLADGSTTLKVRRGNEEVWSWAQLANPRGRVTTSMISSAPVAMRQLKLATPKVPGGALSAEFMRALAQEFGCNVFIETGTASGQTVEAAAGVFDRVETVELGDDLYDTALARVSGLDNVFCHQGDSATWLATAPAGPDKALVWLDAHYSGDGYAQGPENCPLLRELEAIATWPVKPPVILMDDMRYAAPADTPAFHIGPTAGFPSLAAIQAAVKAIDCRYQFWLYGDIGLAYLPHDGFDVSGEVKRCGAERLANHSTEIVILNYNGGESVKQCLASIRHCTRVPYSILVIDQASTDGSLEWLREQQDVRLIENAENVGVPAGRAQALPLTTAKYVVMLDNDTVVTPGWLETFQRHARNHPECGMFGPRSNWASGPQLVQGVPYRDWPGLEHYSGLRLKDNDGKLTPVNRLVGFCMFLTRRLVDKVGNFDGSFGLFGYEDDDYCRRAVLAGFKPAIAEDVFIHHTGGPQWRGDPEYNRQLEQARQRYEAKWAKTPVGVLVFSKDRACQLDLCLESLVDHAKRVQTGRIVVLYTTSSPRYDMQYDQLIAAWKDCNVTFVQQTDFQTDVERITANWEHVAFVVDDAIFIRDFDLDAAIKAIKEHDALGFSLRLGLGLSHGGPPEEEPFKPPAFLQPATPGTYFWSWASTGEPRGWGYPLEVSSSVYPVATIRALTAGRTYTNPNALEVLLDAGKSRYADKPMLCFAHSTAFCAVWNKVQQGNGFAQGMTAEQFADAWDAGKRLDWQAYSGYETRSYHALPEIKWRE